MEEIFNKLKDDYEQKYGGQSFDIGMKLLNYFENNYMAADGYPKEYRNVCSEKLLTNNISESFNREVEDVELNGFNGVKNFFTNESVPKEHKKSLPENFRNALTALHKSGCELFIRLYKETMKGTKKFDEKKPVLENKEDKKKRSYKRAEEKKL